tara:strand:- start:30999 stop:31250 length:252 start_codon:yes stop_codon:yes gene_type:complete
MNEEIIKLITERLEKGAKKYGKPNMEQDGRCFVTEALEEALDLAVYLAARLIEVKKTNSDLIIEELYRKTVTLERKLREKEEK